MLLDAGFRKFLLFAADSIDSIDSAEDKVAKGSLNRSNPDESAEDR